MNELLVSLPFFVALVVIVFIEKESTQENLLPSLNKFGRNVVFFVISLMLLAALVALTGFFEFMHDRQTQFGGAALLSGVILSHWTRKRRRHAIVLMGDK